MAGDAVPQVLVRANALPPSLSLTRALAFESRPLFRSIGTTSALPGAAPGATWHVLRATKAEETVNPWDLCHQLVDGGLGVAAGAIEFAEPDVQQQWLVGRARDLGLAMAGPCGVPAQQNTRYPTDAADDLWFRDDAHGQYDAALAQIGDPGDAARVRIAHLDTGYDADHKTLPQHLNLSLQRNFVDANRPNDARDDSSGLINNLGHGTGTLSILGGKSLSPEKGLGVAPFAEIVPIRVANSVVLFYNSAIAQAFDYVHGLCAKPATRVHVVTMSMGGLPSQAWGDAVNALYEIGVFVVTAAGNNIGGVPTNRIVYPARFKRVVAACGVMADTSPYADLAFDLMAGNYGPDDKMATAVSAYTPNVPWARFGCADTVDGNGSGTSAATPQVAAAAALWIQKNRAAYDGYPQAWMRIEAVRKALFEGAKQDPARRDHIGRGRLQAKAALGIAPAAAGQLAKQPKDTVSFPVASLLFGVAPAMAPTRRAMLDLEAAQVAQSAGVDAQLHGAADELPDRRTIAQAVDAMLAQPGLSRPLRAALGDVSSAVRPMIVRPASPGAKIDPVGAAHLSLALAPPVPMPAQRMLRIYAYDPSSSGDLRTAGVNETVVGVRWEKDLAPGPVGEYLEVVDFDPASGCCYAPVDLNHPHILAQNGLAPSEGNPQFHQQMSYAVAMNTIAHFENALGRRALWSSRPRRNAKGRIVGSDYVQRLRIYPHALRAANSFYSSDRKALLLGYFTARAQDTGTTLPGGRVFCSVSHDIIAHETAHALLDGLHRRYQEATNPDVLAFHEAFADIVALFQHFTLPEALFQQIRQTRGQLEEESLLGRLALQFGEARSGKDQALRNTVGQVNPQTGNWERVKPAITDYDPAKEVHALGAVLVSAVFAAFVQLYKARTEDLVRLATNGSGVLPPGDISYDLARRLAQEAANLARQVLQMCIRALDYCPPVDLTFGEYLRALITADRDLVPNDERGYRVAIITAFRERGIYPAGIRSLSVGSLVWEAPPLELTGLDSILKKMDLGWNTLTDRAVAFATSRENAAKVWRWLTAKDKAEELAALGFDIKTGPRTIANKAGDLRPIEVHSVRPARRIGPDGQSRTSLVVEITQTFRLAPPETGLCRGGCTLLIDLETSRAQYFIRKRLSGLVDRFTNPSAAAPLPDVVALRSNYYGPEADQPEPFALLHGPH